MYIRVDLDPGVNLKEKGLENLTVDSIPPRWF
jgi:hypothetical protein